MGKKHQKWAVGDLFVVETSDSQLVLAQIVGCEPSVLNSVSCAFFDWRVSCVEDIKVDVVDVSPACAFGVLMVTREGLDRHQWKVVGKRSVELPPSMLPNESFRGNGFVGATVIGSGNVEAFINAFYGLGLWDDWHDPEYLDRLLVSPSKKPKDRLRFKVVQ